MQAKNILNESADDRACPRCGSLVWERIQRTRLQRILRPHQGRCYCRSCQREFWRTVSD